MISIAIDGPSGAGKSTIARRLAPDLGFLYIDTGALYRAVALFMLRRELSAENEVAEALAEVTVSLRHTDGKQTVWLGEEDVSDAIRDHRVSRAASDMSAFPAVRAFLLDRQRAFAREHDVIMDGRDIGTVVLPGADVKIFLTADPDDRARRRFLELRERGQEISQETVLQDIRQRDINDSSRAVAPLRPAPDAVVVDTTGNEWEQSVAILRDLIKDRLK